MRRRDLIGLIVGAAFVWPVGARAQQSMPVIGYLSVGSPETDNIPGRLVAFRRGLDEAAMSKTGTSQSNTAGGKATTIDCRL
jgi:hypothetical protein